ncbi:MAG TPA: hypothetical protein VK498_10960 [Ferruginibacter sp.]|nr:hypothetical protein [Ferruginibacter sp.]
MVNEFQEYNPLLNYTPQLYYYPFYSEADKQKVLKAEPEQIGSSVLFKTEKSHFLITAKHVFDNIRISDVIVFLNGDSVIRLPIEAGFIEPIDQQDNKDIIIIQINHELASHFSTRYQFLDHTKIAFRHKFTQEEKYLIFGYINHQTKLHKETFVTNQFGFITSVKELNKIEDLGFNYDDNIILIYNRRKQGFVFSDSPDFGPKDLRGLSGCGVWNIKPDPSNPGHYFYLLTGIMIEERINRGIVIGTQIRLALDILWHRFSTPLMV